MERRARSSIVSRRGLPDSKKALDKTFLIQPAVRKQRTFWWIINKGDTQGPPVSLTLPNLNSKCRRLRPEWSPMLTRYLRADSPSWDPIDFPAVCLCPWRIYPFCLWDILRVFVLSKNHQFGAKSCVGRICMRAWVCLQGPPDIHEYRYSYDTSTFVQIIMPPELAQSAFWAQMKSWIGKVKSKHSIWWWCDLWMSWAEAYSAHGQTWS